MRTKRAKDINEKEEVKIKIELIDDDTNPKIEQALTELRDKPDIEKPKIRSTSIGFKVFEDDKELLEKFARKINNTSAGQLAKKLMYDKYNSSGSTALKILNLLPDFSAKSKDEVIKMVLDLEKKIISVEERKRPKDMQRQSYKLNEK